MYSNKDAALLVASINLKKYWRKRWQFILACVFGVVVNMAGMTDSMAATATYNDVPVGGVAIPDNDCSSPIIRTFTVTESFTVQQIELGLNISHPFRSDLTITLTAPNGASALVTKDTNNSNSNNFNVLLNDFAINQLENGSDDVTTGALYTRTALPVNPFFSRLYGVSSAGTWTLNICDDGNGDEGDYNSSRLILHDTAPELFTGVTDCGGETIYLKSADIAAIPPGGSIGLTDMFGVIDDNDAPMCHFNGTTSETYFCLNFSDKVCSSYYADGKVHLYSPNSSRPDITDLMRAQITWILAQWESGATITGDGRTLDLTTSTTQFVQWAVWCILGQTSEDCPDQNDNDASTMVGAAETAIPDVGSIPAAPVLTLTRTSAATVNTGSTHFYEMTTNQGIVNLMLSDNGTAAFLCDAGGAAISDPDIMVTATTFEDTGISGTETYNLCLTRAIATSVMFSTAVPDNSGGSFTPLSTAQLTHTGKACQNFLRISDIELEAPAAEAEWLLAQVDLELTKTVDNSSPKRGDTVVYTLTVTNSSDTEATGVEVQDLLPSELTYVNHSGGSYDHNTGIWDVGSVAANGSQVLLITVKID